MALAVIERECVSLVILRARDSERRGRIKAAAEENDCVLHLSSSREATGEAVCFPCLGGGAASGSGQLPLQKSLPIALRSAAIVWIFCADRERDPAARRKLRSYDCVPRRTGFHEIVEDAVGHCFVERPLVPV